jgi:hypothetical protein
LSFELCPNAPEHDLEVAALGRGGIEVNLLEQVEDSEHVPDLELGLVALELPAGGAGQGDASVFDRGVDRRGDEVVEHRCLEDRPKGLGLLLALAENPHLQLVLHLRAAAHTLGRALRPAGASTRARHRSQRCLRRAHAASEPASACTANRPGRKP